MLFTHSNGRAVKTAFTLEYLTHGGADAAGNVLSSEQPTTVLLIFRRIGQYAAVLVGFGVRFVGSIFFRANF